MLYLPGLTRHKPVLLNNSNMRCIPAKVAACIVGGLLFVTTGCNPATGSTPAAVQPGTEKTPLPTVTHPANTGVALVATAIATPTPSPTPLPTPTPRIPPLPIPTPSGPPYTYHTISEGETLSYIALRYNTTVEALAEMNNLPGPSAIIQSGQSLRVPLDIRQTSPPHILLPDSEVVYSPAYLNFNIAEFVAGQGGYLASYREYVDAEELTGAEIVQRVAQQFSVGPRLLLALLEHYGGWVTNPNPPADLLNQPLGPRNPRGGDLYRALGFTANRINAGYYGYKRDGFWVFELPDRNRAITPQGLNAGTVGLQNILAIHSDWDTWQQELGPDGFMADYRTLFGDPLARAVDPLVPATLTQPKLDLPWPRGNGFYFTGGPHPAYADGSAWAAIDFGPPDVLGNCFYSDYPATAAADGIVVVARQGEVYLDLDGDGRIQTGWTLQYLHVALDVDQPVQVGQAVARGDVIGYASCEGGLASSSHIHLARRYNGEWIDAGGPIPMVLSGWVVQPNLTPYAGSITAGSETREACECWEPDLNLIIHPPGE